jgi:hypothetical protein
VYEENTEKYDYVKAEIMTLDLEKVPVVPAAVLGKCIYDFHYHREVSEEEFNRQHIQTRVEEGYDQKEKINDTRYDHFSGQLKKSFTSQKNDTASNARGFMKDDQKSNKKARFSEYESYDKLKVS